MRIYSLFRNSANIFKTVSRSSVAPNIASLYIVQFTNYVLPLITIPYLVRILGPANFGLVAFGQSLIGYFNIVTDYGFAFSATRKISVKREDPIAVNRIVFEVWAAKTLLCVVGFAALLLLITIVPQLRESRSLLLILYGAVVGNMLFPIWLFQGMEKMVAISMINLGLRLVIVIGTFLTIHFSQDYLRYAALTSLAPIGASLVGVGVAFYIFKLHPVTPTWRGIWETYVDGWMLFLSQASVSLYTVGNAFLLGLMANPSAVGYYSAAEKIVKAGFGLLGPISQATYPKFSKLASDSREQALRWGRRMFIMMGSIGLALSSALFFGAPILVRIVLGPEYASSVLVMRILAGLPFLVAISNVFGIQLMLPFGKDKAFTAILFGAGFINIALAIFFIPIWQHNGLAVSVLLSEAFVTIAMMIYLITHHLNIFVNTEIDRKALTSRR